MADEQDEGDLQATKSWASLTASLGVKTPRKLEAIGKLTQRIRASPAGKRPKGK